MNILFQDNFLIAVNKPAGMLVVPAPGRHGRTVTGLLELSYERVFVCHRLDRDTSGVILYARDGDTQKKMWQKFRRREIKKVYIALVSGLPAKKEGVISKGIEGKEAVTKYTVLGRGKGYSILIITPVTGRRNQIRIHLKSIGHPVLGERKFAFGKDFKVKFRRTALHSLSAFFIHPVTNKGIRIKAALSADMKKMIDPALLQKLGSM